MLSGICVFQVFNHASGPSHAAVTYQIHSLSSDTTELAAEEEVEVKL